MLKTWIVYKQWHAFGKVDFVAHLTFNQITFDQLTFGQLIFGQMTFGQVTFD